MRKKKISTELIVGVLASFIAICSLFVTFWQAIQIQEHNKLSVKPILRFDMHKMSSSTDTSKITEYKLLLANRGIGPAIIKSFNIYLGDKSYHESGQPWKELLDDAGEKNSKLNYTFFDPEDVIEAKSITHLITLPELKSLDQIRVVIEYESMYKEQFKVERKFK